MGYLLVCSVRACVPINCVVCSYNEVTCLLLTEQVFHFPVNVDIARRLLCPAATTQHRALQSAVGQH